MGKSGLCVEVCALYMEVCYSDRWEWIFMIMSRYEHMLDKSWLA